MKTPYKIALTLAITGATIFLAAVAWYDPAVAVVIFATVLIMAAAIIAGMEANK